MKIQVYNQKFSHITNNSEKCSKQCAFLLTCLNKKHLEKAKQKTPYILNGDDLYSFFDIKIKIIAITGTNGKTTTSMICGFMLNELNIKTATLGTCGFYINNKYIEKTQNTTPDVFELFNYLLKAQNEKCEYLIMEASSHAIAQNRMQGVDFFAKAITNITQDHLDFHKTIQEYKKIKNDFLNDCPIIISNLDDGNINNKNSFTSYSLKNTKADYYAKVKNLSDFVLHHNNEFFDIKTNLIGKFNIYNSLLAISLIHQITNTNLEDIIYALEKFTSVDGRMQIVNKQPLIIVDFAHTPDAMKNIFEIFKNDDICVVFGAGGDRDISKREKMGYIASKYAKKIYITNDNPRSEEPKNIANEIAKGIEHKQYKILLDRKEAIKEAIKNLKEKEILLVLGKGDERYQEVNNTKHPFYDVDIIKSFVI